MLKVSETTRDNMLGIIGCLACFSHYIKEFVVVRIVFYALSLGAASNTTKR